MIIGLPKEIKNQEHRIALTPATVAELVKRGHQVLLQESAGAGASYTDVPYLAAGAQVVNSAAEVFSTAQMIVKVKEPQMGEVDMLRNGQILFTYLHLAANKPLTEALRDSGCTALAYETLTVDGRRPLLEPMSEIAGSMASMVGAYHLAKNLGGRGLLLGGVTGVPAGRVTVMGGGSAGMNAARVAAGMGAEVTILELDVERMRFLERNLSGVRCLFSSQANLVDLLPRTDLLVGAVLVPGAAAPKLITRAMLKLMQAGAVFVDIAVDQGGCAETTRPTTHDHPTYIEEGVLHYSVANMPAAYARTATQALDMAINPWVLAIAERGLENACQLKPELVSAINCQNKQITCQPVADAHGLSQSIADSSL
ncbi:alanine dehydrogenase [Persicirhabdus sediminis]|uniref:Alanine dehydrogenase n=1 Tax=Persicirhabdus sediminis TaxID=454144 RepID=A0A8J7ME69_9BACT|nr:alanine dehydrogenase [Persicirhabdus sediminis]MBK1791060.1 alanine dehydrogenase [Persicirhabdus sediminis]